MYADNDTSSRPEPSDAVRLMGASTGAGATAPGLGDSGVSTCAALRACGQATPSVASAATAKDGEEKRGRAVRLFLLMSALHARVPVWICARDRPRAFLLAASRARVSELPR